MVVSLSVVFVDIKRNTKTYRPVYRVAAQQKSRLAQAVRGLLRLWGGGVDSGNSKNI